MQFKLIAASIAALSVGSAIAGPLPILLQDDGLVAREAAPVAQPEAAPEPLKARTEQFIQIQQQAHSWADTQAWQVPSKEQLTFAHSCFPQQAWDQNFYGINDYPQGWDARIWNYYYLYYYYQQYNFQWTDYWPNWDTDYNQDWCTPGWC